MIRIKDICYSRDRRLVSLNVDNSENPVVALTSPGASHLDTDGYLHIGAMNFTCV